MKKLKEDIDIVAFLENVKGCVGDVSLETDEGDKLNLKSILSQYLFVVIGENKDLLKESRIICNSEDARRLKGFIL